MGVYLRDELAGLGFDVYVTSRRLLNDYGNVRFLHGDAHRDADLDRFLSVARPDVIFDFMLYSTDEFSARCSRLVNSVGQYVFVSSYRVFADSEVLTECSPRLLDVSGDEEFLASNEYSLSKARQEDVLRCGIGKNWTIVRPSITYSKTRFQLGCLEADVVLFRAFKGRPVPLPTEMLSRQTTMTWAGDVAKMMARLALNPKAMAEDFNVVTSEHHSWREIAEIYDDAIGLCVKECSLSEYLTFCAKYQTIYDRMFNRVMDNQKVLSVTGMSQGDLSAVSDSLSRELVQFKKCPVWGYVDPVRNARIDRVVGGLTNMGVVRSELAYLSSRYDSVGRLEKIVRKVMRKV